MSKLIENNPTLAKKICKNSYAKLAYLDKGKVREEKQYESEDMIHSDKCGPFKTKS